jgi:hypothetical protein
MTIQASVPPASVPLRIAIFEAIGFLAVVAVIWLDELLDLPHRLLGAPATPLRIQEAWLESLLVVALGLLVVTASLRLARQLAYLRSFVVICAWCRRVRAEATWISFERFLASHRASTSHGICPDCALRLEEGAGFER